MLKLLMVALGGSLGAMARAGITAFVAQRFSAAGYPLGTLVCNLFGCLFLGFLMTLVERQQLSAEVRVLLTTGLMGSFTTFSTFSYETVRLVGEGQGKSALVNVAVSVLFGLFAVVLGAKICEAMLASPS